MLVGRDAELDSLNEALAAVEEGEPRSVAFVGEAGIGKTSLLQELRVKAREREWLVLEGRGSELERQLPFGLIVDAFDLHLGALTLAGLEDVGGGDLEELVRMLPSLPRSDAASTVPLDAERYRAHQAIARLIVQLANERPLVLTLDDLHWADSASIEVVAYLLRHPPPAPVLLALAYRPERGASPVDKRVHAAAKDGFLDLHQLFPLTKTESEALLSDRADPALRESIYTASGGNPFYLNQLSRAVRAPGAGTVSPRRVESLAPTVPPAVTAAIDAEGESLPRDARELMAAAAVVGERFLIDTASDVAGLDEERALAALDELIMADLVHPTEAPREFEFRHPIVRQAIYQRASVAWRLEAHRQTAAVLDAAGAPASARAVHVERYAARGDEEALSLLTEVAAQAAPRAPEVAARWYRSALRLVPEGGPPERRLMLLGPLASALAASGRLEGARAALVEAVDLAPPEAATVRAQMVGFIADLEQHLGRYVEARRLLTGSLTALDNPVSPEAATLQLALGREGWRAGNPDACVKWAGIARETAAQLASYDTPALRMGAASLTAVGEATRGNVPAARTAAVEAGRIVDGVSDDELACNVLSFVSLGFAEVVLELYDVGERHIERGLAAVRASSQSYALAPLKTALAWLRLQQGRLADAVDDIAGVVEASRLDGNSQYLAWGQYLNCRHAGLVGDLRAAVEFGNEAIAATAGTPNLFFDWLAHVELGVVMIEAGETARGREEILAHVGGSDLPLAHATSRPWIYEPLVRAALAEGDLEGAEAWVERAERAAAQVGLPGGRGIARMVRGSLLEAQERHGEAVEAAVEAASLLGENGHRLEVARSRMLAGRALVSDEQPGRAATELEAAHAEFAACGAERMREEAARLLRGMGRRVSKAGVANLGSGTATLSPRETEVAALIVEGLTNPQIAARLYISKKTVEVHVSNIFVKLGVSSRGAVPRALVRVDVRSGPSRESATGGSADF